MRSEGETPLHEASLYGYVEASEELLRAQDYDLATAIVAGAEEKGMLNPKQREDDEVH